MQRKFIIVKYIFLVSLGLLILASFIFLRLNPFQILMAFYPMVIFLVENFFPPNLTHLTTFLPALFETLFLAIVATYISAFIAFFFAILMSSRLSPHVILQTVMKIFISIIRNIPVLIWASILVFIFGIGQMVGIASLILSTVGFLTRSYAESMDDILDEKLEALKATGASYFQIIIHGILPEFMPAWINWTLFSFELNLRISAVLGIVGAGGIGTVIAQQLNLRNFNTAAAFIMSLVVLVLLIEYLVGRLRKKIVR